jgi:alcohol dehydrogenase, propanol-preferring
VRYAGRTYTSLMVNCPVFTIRLFRGMKSWVLSMRLAKMRTGLRLGSELECLGWPKPAGTASTAFPGVRIFAMIPPHVITQICRWQKRRVFAFTRPGDTFAQVFARSLGVEWAGASDESPPEPLDAAIIFAPVGDLIPTALRAIKKGGRVVCGGIYMSDIPSFPYGILWEERQLVSVANLTRRDAGDFLPIARQARVRTSTTVYRLDQANEAIRDLREGRLRGAAVLVPTQPV